MADLHPFTSPATLTDQAGPAAVVAVDNIAVTYAGAAPALDGVTFALAPGSFTFVTGGSGAGKTTLLNVIGLALPAVSGTVQILGRNPMALPRPERSALRRQIGMVFQDFRLLEHLSVLENVALPLRVEGVGESRRRAQASELLAWVGLGDRLAVLPLTLSGGQKQRVAIARAVINRPQLLLADEPTGSIDDEIGMRVIRLFQALHGEGTTVLIATHNTHLVQALDYPVLHLAAGRVQTFGQRPSSLAGDA
jgi:cell division transport system ATP-binding protein